MQAITEYGVEFPVLNSRSLLVIYLIYTRYTVVCRSSSSSSLSLPYPNSLVGFPGGSLVKTLPAKAGDVGLIPGLGRFLAEGSGNSRQYSCLGNPTDRGRKRGGYHLATKQQQHNLLTPW